MEFLVLIVTTNVFFDYIAKCDAKDRIRPPINFLDIQPYPNITDEYRPTPPINFLDLDPYPNMTEGALPYYTVKINETDVCIKMHNSVTLIKAKFYHPRGKCIYQITSINHFKHQIRRCKQQILPSIYKKKAGLVSILDEGTLKFILRNFDNNEDDWFITIGLYDENQNGKFFWQNGNIPYEGFPHWGKKAIKSEKYPGTGCVGLDYEGRIFPTSCDNLVLSVCEVNLPSCKRDNGGCSHFCSQTEPGSVVCLCRPGYRLINGTICEDNDECQVGNGGCQGICTNRPGYRLCTCPDGYMVHHQDCLDINECASLNGGCQHHCSNTIGSFRCYCGGGLVEDGPRCKQWILGTVVVITFNVFLTTLICLATYLYITQHVLRVKRENVLHENQRRSRMRFSQPDKAVNSNEEEEEEEWTEEDELSKFQEQKKIVFNVPDRRAYSTLI